MNRFLNISRSRRKKKFNDKIIVSRIIYTTRTRQCDDNVTYSVGATSGSFLVEEIVVNLIFIFYYIYVKQTEEVKN